MNTGLKTIIYPVKDLPAAKAVYADLLSTDPDMDEPYYVGFTVGDQHVGLDPNGHARGMTGPVAYWHVDDIRQAAASLASSGATERQAVQDVGGGKLTAELTDADGNVIGLIQTS